MKKSYLFGIIAVVLVVTVGLLIGLQSDDVMSNSDNMMEKDTEMTQENDMMEDEEMASEEMMKDEEMVSVEIMNDGDMAPTFSLMDLDDQQVNLAHLNGNKVYVKFWASWCSICLAGMEELDELSMSEDIMVYTIVSPGHNGEQSKEEFIEWFDSLGYNNIRVLFDETGDIQKEYGIRGFPTSVYIGSDGVLVKTMPGHASNEMVYNTFEEIK